MNVHAFTTDQEAARTLAEQIAAALRDEPALVLGLPTGRTPLPLYRQLATLCAHGIADFSRATTFNLDELLGVPPGDPGSFRAYMDHHLFRHVNLSRRRINFLNGSAVDAEVECRRYDDALRAAGGIGLLVVGIGVNGHIGFNEPGASLVARTHRVVLTPETRRANAALFSGEVDRVPGEALSMGMAAILEARSIVLLATGRDKAASVERMIEGPVTTALPASFLQLHRQVDIMLDEAAAERLRT